MATTADKHFTRSVTGRVLTTKRHGTSPLGNPSYDVVIESVDGTVGIYRTTANSGLAYEITDRKYRETVHTFGLTKAGNLNGYTLDV